MLAQKSHTGFINLDGNSTDSSVIHEHSKGHVSKVCAQENCIVLGFSNITIYNFSDKN